MTPLKTVDDAVDRLADEKSPGKFERKILLYIIAVLLAFGASMGLRYVTGLETTNAKLEKENADLRAGRLGDLQKVVDEKQKRLDDTRNFRKTLDSINNKLPIK